MVNLVKKYDVQGPRYTSYPPVPFWKGAPSLDQWHSDILKSYKDESGVDVYIHVPYCYTICHYCGCNRVAAIDNSPEENYLNLLLKEWEQYRESVGDLRVNSVHFGGGTPTFLSAQSFARIMKVMTQKTTESFIASVELHPQVTLDDHLSVFKEYGIERISMGVQDLNDQVLTSINRNCTVEQNLSLYKKLRDLKFKSINFDLIYGLPHQTLESMERTFDSVCELAPDLIAYYSFAYVPWKMENQKKIDENALPSPELKKQLFNLGKQKLLDAGYIAIGLDHFAKKDSFLGKAYLEKRLNRSFMGYVDKKSDVLLGLGPSAISNTPFSFAQNHKMIDAYQVSVESSAGDRFCNGHEMTCVDQSASQIIHDIMCKGGADISSLSASEEKLLEMQDDNLLELDGQNLVVTEIGMPFSRNIAMLFDQYLPKKKSGDMFSKTV